MESERCSVCNDFERRLLTTWINMSQHRIAFDFTPSELLQTQTTCQYCYMIYNGVQHFRDEIGDIASVVSRIYARGPASTPPNTLTLEIYFKDEREKLELEFLTHDEKGGSAVKEAIRHTNQTYCPLDPMSEKNVSWVGRNIEACTQTHIKCMNRQETNLPSRILCLTRSSQGELEVRLQECKDMKGKYACLSVCSGKASEASATFVANYASRIEGIFLSEMPETIRDAVQFADTLGIRYLWIGSLCIIQDDPNDWKVHSKRLAGIFENSYLTIAATAATDQAAGLFWSEDTIHGRTIDSSVAEKLGCTSLSIRKVMHHWERTWTSTRRNRFPLLTRGWFFQERLLSPRLLHFSHQEMIWECKTHGECQCGGLDSRSNAKTLSWQLDNSWRSAVELYTCLELTRKEDRLEALQGFAEVFSKFIASSFHKDYIKGLWKGTIHLDLLWRIDNLSLSEKPIRMVGRCWDTEQSLQVLAGKSQTTLKQFRAVDAPTVEKSFLRSCQYSYSAACSRSCFKSRKLCRYGDESAALELVRVIEGPSCVDGSEGTTGIRELYQHEQETPRESANSGNIEPSWSWASARRNVKYWTDVIYYDKSDGYSKACRFHGLDTINTESSEENETLQNGSNTEEEVPASLKAQGYLVPATLHYQYIPFGNSLASEDQPGEDYSQLRSKATSSHDILKYCIRVSLNSSYLDFHPDWIFSLEGQHFIPNGTQLFLFHIISNVYLVLKEKWFFDVPCNDRPDFKEDMRTKLMYKIGLQKRRVETGDYTLTRLHGEEVFPPTKGEIGQPAAESGANETAHIAGPGAEPEGNVSLTNRERSGDANQEHPVELSDPYIEFVRVGILRVPLREADSLHKEVHWIDKIEIF